MEYISPQIWGVIGLYPWKFIETAFLFKNWIRNRQEELIEMRTNWFFAFFNVFKIWEKSTSKSGNDCEVVFVGPLIANLRKPVTFFDWLLTWSFIISFWSSYPKMTVGNGNKSTADVRKSRSQSIWKLKRTCEIYQYIIWMITWILEMHLAQLCLSLYCV